MESAFAVYELLRRHPRAARFNARSIFSTVRTVGDCNPFSSRQIVSCRTPASLASCSWVSPSALRSRIMLRAMLARTYSNAGKFPSSSGSGNGGRLTSFAILLIPTGSSPGGTDKRVWPCLHVSGKHERELIRAPPRFCLTIRHPKLKQKATSSVQSRLHRRGFRSRGQFRQRHSVPINRATTFTAPRIGDTHSIHTINDPPDSFETGATVRLPSHAGTTPLDPLHAGSTEVPLPQYSTHFGVGTAASGDVGRSWRIWSEMVGFQTGFSTILRMFDSILSSRT